MRFASRGFKAVLLPQIQKNGGGERRGLCSEKPFGEVALWEDRGARALILTKIGGGLCILTFF